MSSCKLIVLPCLAAMWLECGVQSIKCMGWLDLQAQQEPSVKWDCKAMEAHD